MSKDVAVLGVGMHPWGKWGQSFVGYGVKAAQDALKDAGVEWKDIQLVAGGDTMRNGYPATWRARPLHKRSVGPVRRCRARMAHARPALRRLASRGRTSWLGFARWRWWSAQTPPRKGFFAPTGGRRPEDPDWLRFHIQGITNPTYFGLYARRRMDVYGATQEDFAAVKVKNSKHGLHNPNARYRKEVAAKM